MTDNEIRKTILKALYGKYREAPGYGQLSMGNIAYEFQIEEGAMEFNTHFLVDHGFIDFAALGGELEILAKGLSFIEGPSEFNPPQTYLRQSIEISGGHVGQINQAHTITNPSLFLGRLAEAIENHPDLDREKRKGWKETLLEMSKHPALVELLRFSMASGVK